MYRLIIVDDEENTRLGLAEYVAWPELGYVLVGAFADGQTVIDWLGTNHADVVLTDIRMPDISGLDLAEQIRHAWPSTHVVVISGHKEFDYARRAIEFGVRRYLLKPTRLEAVRSAFRELKEELDAERAESRAAYQGSERYHEALPYLRDQFFWDLLNGNLIRETDIRKRAALIDLPFSPLDTQCGILTIRATPDPFENLGDSHARSRAFTGVVKDSVTIQRCFVTTTSASRYSVFFVDSDAEERAAFPVRIRDGVDAIVRSLRRVSNGDVRVSTPRVYRSLFEAAMNSGRGKLDADNVPDLGPDDAVTASLQRYQAVLQEFHHGDLRRGLQCFEELVREIETDKDPMIARLVIGAMAAADARLGEVFGDRWFMSEESFPFRGVATAADAEEIRAQVLPILERISTNVARRSSIAACESIGLATEYIERNYSRDISLQDVASHVRLSSAYLSRLFQKEMGITFSDFLANRRLQCAAQLLSEAGHKVGEVAVMCGYSDPKYFARVFRKRFGLNPSAFGRRDAVDRTTQ